jgi:hypothetical protein
VRESLFAWILLDRGVTIWSERLPAKSAGKCNPCVRYEMEPMSAVRVCERPHPIPTRVACEIVKALRGG